MDWALREAKRQSRAYALDGYQQQHGAIFLPGWDDLASQAGQDIRLALKQGRLRLDAPLYVVERDIDIAPKIIADLTKLGFTNLVPHIGELSTLVINHQIDFAFIDLFGSLSKDLSVWMRDVLAPKLAPDATVVLTVSYGLRANDFMKGVCDVYSDHYPEEIEAVRDRYQISKSHRLAPLLLTRAIFNDHLFTYRKLMKYKDNVVSMLTYKFTDFQPMSEGNRTSPALAAILARLPTKEEDEDMTNRTDAANKAWATRRSNIISQKRSAAAHKAWETRRATPPTISVDTRSQAALKAWETRRANGWVHPSKRA